MAWDDPPPTEAAALVKTMHAVVQGGGNKALADILFHAHSRLTLTDYDNWNGGTFTWTLELELDPIQYGSIQSHRDRLQNELLKIVSFFDDRFRNHQLASVVLLPGEPGRTTPQVLEAEAEKIWGDGVFRLFVSHVSAHRDFAKQFSEKLSEAGVRAFVAHDDIEPTAEWQATIEKALSSAHALVALLTPDFHESKWTDQEVGWAMGRGILVVPVCLGLAPYGLMGKYQGSPATADGKAQSHAWQVIELLLKNPKTRPMMSVALVNAFVDSTSWSQARELSKLIVKLEDLSTDQISRIKEAAKSNSQIGGAYGVVQRIEKHFGPIPPPIKPAAEANLPF